MPVEIKTIVDEQERACGYRKAGGLYLISRAFDDKCHLLPFELKECEKCFHKVEQTRGWQWLKPKGVCPVCTSKTRSNGHQHNTCPVCTPVERGGVMWAGTRFYTAESFLQEAREMGISKRISSLQIPKDFKIGQEFVFLASPEAVQVMEDDLPVGKDGIFCVFVPQAIEYIVSENDTEKELEQHAARGYTLVRLTRTDGLDVHETADDKE